MYKQLPLPDTHDFSHMTCGKGKGGAIGITDETGQLVAYVWYTVSDRTCWMDMIYVIEKERGHGSAIIRFLFEELDIDRMGGTVLKDEIMRAYYFWLSLGATMDAEDEDEYRDYCREGIDVGFELPRENLWPPVPLKTTS